ncbi:MAG: ABC transporter substrate-binding protein [Deltaproteobacteria bacterium]|nr:ABC transporter substrate-binding protein [Deltaproteobacteria bacterium]
MARGKFLPALLIFVIVSGLHPSLMSDSHAQIHTVKIAIPQKGLFDTTIPTMMAEKKGFLKEQGIKPEIFWTSGGAETVRVVTAGSADIGLATGTESVITAFGKGSPVRIISAEITGSPDLFWIVRSDSPFKTIKDLDGKSVGFSRPGSSTHMIFQLASEHYKIKPNLVAVGGVPDSFTAVMTRQVDAGWSSPPYLLDRIEKGEIRIVFRASELETVRTVTMRVNFANASFYEKNKGAVQAFVRALKKSIDYMYDHPKETVALFAEVNKFPLSVAEAGFKFFPKESLVLSPVSRVDFSVDLALKLKMITKPPTADELKKLIVVE